MGFGGPGGFGGRRGRRYLRHHEHGFPGFLGRGPRAGRGDVRAAILALLAEQPMHGYQIMRELGERSGGVWRPSPGSIYPTLQQLEDEELVRPETGDGGRRVFALTDAGREAQKAAAGGPAPWEEVGVEGDVTALELRDLVGQVVDAARQVLHAGEAAQIAQAKDVLRDARRKLYRILAEDSPETHSAAERGRRVRGRALAGPAPGEAAAAQVALHGVVPLRPSAAGARGHRLRRRCDARPPSGTRRRVPLGPSAAAHPALRVRRARRDARRRYRPPHARRAVRPPACWPSRAVRQAPDTVIEGAQVFGAFTREWLEGDVAIADGRFAGHRALRGRRAHRRQRALAQRGLHRRAHARRVVQAQPSAELARVLVARGTTTIVCDPHELANALGPEGVHWFIDACEGLPLDVLVFAPSAVPASPFESPRAPLSLDDIAGILARERVIGLAEMMNYPAVIAGAPEELAKIALAAGKRIDGHAPGVGGPSLDAYLATGIASDHEATVARARRSRSGGAARGCCCARPRTPATCAICCRSCASTGPSDARSAPTTASPTSSCARATSTRCAASPSPQGISPEDALLLATLHPALCHGLPRVGAIAPGYRADCVLLDDLGSFRAALVLKDGRVVARDGVAAPFASAPAPDWVRDSVRIAPLPPTRSGCRTRASACARSG